MGWELIVGGTIRRLRKAAGLSQEALAERAGLALRYVSGVERGEENPSLRSLVALAEALDIHPARLFDG